MSLPPQDVLIVGAGVAGLTLARELTRRGRSPIVLERSRGVGGRCATRRVDGQPVDHGVAFFHGRSDAFLAELADVREASRLAGWPATVDGDGTPCRPDAFVRGSDRIAFAEGVNRFPKHLAAGLDIRCDARVMSITAPSDMARAPHAAWRVALSNGDTLSARVLALTTPAPTTRDLLADTASLPDAIAALLPVLALVQMLPCLTVIARYAPGTPVPPWQLAYPRESTAIHSVIHDSSKRTTPDGLTLVIQARPAWSRAHLQEPPDTWASLLLAEAARLYGTWLAVPASFQAHAWRKARVAPGSELAQPLLVSLASGALLGCAGDGFDPAGGIEGAYRSGVHLASRIDTLLGHTL